MSDKDEDGRASEDGRRLLARFFLPLDMRTVAKSLVLFGEAYPHATLDNPGDDNSIVDIYDRPVSDD